MTECRCHQLPPSGGSWWQLLIAEDLPPAENISARCYTSNVGILQKVTYAGAGKNNNRVVGECFVICNTVSCRYRFDEGGPLVVVQVRGGLK